MQRGGCVYMMTNPNNSTIYTGATSNLLKRVQEHKAKTYETSFTAKYNCIKLVYYQFFSTIEEAIAEEKRIKGGNRTQKENLITNINPEWKDMWAEIDKNW